MDTASQEPSALVLVAILVAFPVVFIGFWSFVSLLLGGISGWTGLARRYRTDAVEPAGSVTATYARLGLVNYKFSLNLGAASDGLDLRLMPLFRPGHAPLRIPWAEVVEEGTSSGMLGPFVRLRLGESGPVLRLPAGTWEDVRARQPR